MYFGGVNIIDNERFHERVEDQSYYGQILFDQLRILFSHIVPNIVGSVLIVLIYYWVFRDSFTTNLQYYWFGVLISLFIIRLYLYSRFIKGTIEHDPKKCLIIYTVIMFLTGATWGGIIFIPTDLMDNQLIALTLVTLLLALSCISSISSSAHPAVIWSFLIPVGISASYYLMNSASEEYGLIIGLGAIAFCGAAGFVGHTIHNMIVSALYLQNRNMSLMDEVVKIAKQNQKSYESFQILLDNLGAGAAMFDKDDKVISWNKSFEGIFSMPKGLIKQGMSMRELVRKIIKQSWKDAIDVSQAAEAHIKELMLPSEEKTMVKLVLADGRNLYSKVMRINDEQTVLNYTDVTTLEQARTDDIIHVLQHDSLTGLPNQILLKKIIDSRISEFDGTTRSKKNKQKKPFMGLVHFGLNSLNEIYEFLGLGAGDMVVTEVANRCAEFLGDGVQLYHTAYDEFHIITEVEQDRKQAMSLVDELIKYVGEPIDVNGNSITMTVSVGISVYPDHADKTDMLIRNAKIAYNKAKLPNEDNIVIYNHGMHSEIMERSNILFDIHDSMKKSQFSLHYQPQIDIKSRNICGVEALLRWQHPDKGWISPSDFIPLAEHTKQIIPLTEQFLPEACLQAKKWQDMGLPPIRMSVNISPFHFHERGFTKFIKTCLENANLDPELLELEITEGVIMNQTEEIINTLHELTKLGVQLSIDDFGTGYSSLSYLRRLPVDKLKIDQAFIKDMANDESALSLVEAVIRLGHSFNLNVIAEGVETEEQLNKLFAMNCDQAQGYFIKKPDSADVISQWLQGNHM